MIGADVLVNGLRNVTNNQTNDAECRGSNNDEQEWSN